MIELVIVALMVAAWKGRGAWEHGRAARQESRPVRAGQVARATRGGRARQRGTAARHDAAWWVSEALHGFPVHHTGWQAGTLAHRTEALHHRARREEARTTHEEVRASVLKELPEHRARQAAAREAQRKILEQARAAGKPDGGKEAVDEAAQVADVLPFERPARTAPLPSETVTPRPGPYARPAAAKEATPSAGRDSDWLNPAEPRCPDCDGAGCAVCGGWGNAPWDPSSPDAPEGTICAACGNPASADDPVQRQPNGYPIHRSHAIEAQRIQKERREQQEAAQMSSDAARNPEPIPPSPSTEGAPVSDTTFTTVRERATAFVAQADQDMAAIEASLNKAIADADGMQAADVDSATLGEQMDLIDRLQAARSSIAAVGEQAGVIANGIQQRHGALDEAHRDAPVRAANRLFYAEGE